MAGDSEAEALQLLTAFVWQVNEMCKALSSNMH